MWKIKINCGTSVSCSEIKINCGTSVSCSACSVLGKRSKPDTSVAEEHASVLALFLKHLF